MTWSKVISYIFNLIASVLIWSYLVESKVDAKLAAGLYSAYVLLYMFFSDWLTKKDAGSSISKANIEIDTHKGKILKYEKCILEVHHSIVLCLQDNLRGAPLKHTLGSITMQLSAVTLDVANDPNQLPKTQISESTKRKMEELDIFIAGQTRD